MAFERIDLSITRTSSKRVSVSAVSRMGAVHGVELRGLAVAPGQFAEFATAFGEAIARGHRDPGLATRVGGELRRLLFDDGAVLTLFERTRGASADAGNPLLVRILASSRELANLPWELLLDPSDGDGLPLTLSADAHVARLARVRTYPTHDRAVSPPLRVLLVLSSPPFGAKEGEEPVFDVYEEKRTVLQALEPLIDAGLVEVDAEDRPTVARLRQRIARRERGYHIVHYIGHADPGGLLLESSVGRQAKTNPDRFVDLLRQCPDLLMAYFGGCETARAAAARTGEHTAPLSLSEHCVRDSCALVLGMQAVLPMPTERLLNSFFYDGITSGRTVADAVRLARAAVRDDEHVGGGRLDWAVPCLHVGGETAGAVIDRATPATPVTRSRREELNFGKVEAEREFVAREVAVRATVDHLVGRSDERILWVAGPGDEPERLVARALDDVGAGLDYVLWMTWTELHDKPELSRPPDPLLEVCRRLDELFARRDGYERPPARRRSGARWWERLVEEVVRRRVAIVVAEADRHPAGVPNGLEPLADALLRRRTDARLVLLGQDRVAHLPAAGKRGHLVRVVRIPELGWPDIQRWLRRHRPALLARFDDLQPAYLELRSELELWSQLAEEASRYPHLKLSALLERIAAVPLPPAPEPETAADPGILVAAAGPFLAGRLEEFASAMTELAATHRVGGWVAGVDGERSTSTPIASLLDLVSPFGSEGQASTGDVLLWLQDAIEQSAEMLLCDFGTTELDVSQQTVVAHLAALDVLLVASGGNNGAQPTYPAWHREVLAVGSLDEDGGIAPYSGYDPQARKPDLFAIGTVAGTSLAGAVTEPERHGSSFAAMRAMAAALLVWATDRSLHAEDVRSVMVATAAPLDPADPDGPRALDLDAALRHVRTGLLMRALAEGPLDLRLLAAASGLRSEVATTLIDELIADGTLALLRGEGERYALAGGAGA